MTTHGPSARELAKLSRLVDGYPVSRDELIWIAQEAKLGVAMLRFLAHYPEDRVFLKPDDFTATSEEVELLSEQKRNEPAEILRGPQD